MILLVPVLSLPTNRRARKEVSKGESSDFHSDISRLAIRTEASYYYQELPEQVAQPLERWRKTGSDETSVFAKLRDDGGVGAIGKAKDLSESIAS